ncbi:type IV pilus twitching motility protein PilT [Chloracidobacterium validum]|uniref:Type IV pilus twitching motility protein PilT n=1 Tax=Chloracidobacterium validum TaxID=2821543 RepID=A0ABX8BCH6_9BACT|nr:type IV pilus twitching motility protein PilT [Chloracidobacterium validum]QUW03344.1 type IV pilus twitching motility protein PilT [Chloracidobacterium validum]
MSATIESMLKDPRMAGADQLVLQAGKAPTVLNSSGATELSRSPMTPFDIYRLLQPHLPDDKKTALMSQPTTNFRLTVNGAGTFDVSITKEGGGMRVAFVPVGAMEAKPPTPSAPLPPPIQPPRPSGHFNPPQNVTPPRPVPPMTPPRPTPRPMTPPSGTAFSGTVSGKQAPVTPPPTGPHLSNTASAASSSPSPTPTATGQGPAVHLRKRGPLEIDKLFEKQLELKASDMHISASMPPMLRLDGDMVIMQGYEGQPLTAADTERILWELMPDKNREEFNRRHDTDFAYEFGDMARFRCNVFMDRKGMGGVFRVIPSKILTAEMLGLSKEILKLCYLSKGLVLVTGPTGSGKSTTLCALIDFINRNRRDHIITIEDPIEFVHENKQCLINQREVHNHTDSFKDALRAALREDPDIVLVGEMRDLETISIAIETAETGHLVFGTLHTSTAPSTVDRIIDQFPADRQSQIRVMLSESLKGVIAQTLCKKIGGGRVAALETLICDTGIANLIREGKTFQIPSAMQTGKAKGNVTLNDALLDHVKNKRVEAQEAYIKAVDKAGFEGLLKRNNLDVSFLTNLANANA